MSEYNSNDELDPILVKRCRLLTAHRISSAWLFAVAAQLVCCFDDVFETAVDELERVRDRVERRPELVRCACEHDLLAPDVVVRFFELDDVGRVDEDVHEAGLVVPLDLHRLDIEDAFDSSVVSVVVGQRAVWRMTDDLDFVLMHDLVASDLVLMTFEQLLQVHRNRVADVVFALLEVDFDRLKQAELSVDTQNLALELLVAEDRLKLVCSEARVDDDAVRKYSQQFLGFVDEFFVLQNSSSQVGQLWAQQQRCCHKVENSGQHSEFKAFWDIAILQVDGDCKVREASCKYQSVTFPVVRSNNEHNVGKAQSW